MFVLLLISVSVARTSATLCYVDNGARSGVAFKQFIDTFGREEVVGLVAHLFEWRMPIHKEYERELSTVLFHRPASVEVTTFTENVLCAHSSSHAIISESESANATLAVECLRASTWLQKFVHQHTCSKIWLRLDVENQLDTLLRDLNESNLLNSAFLTGGLMLNASSDELDLILPLWKTALCSLPMLKIEQRDVESLCSAEPSTECVVNVTSDPQNRTSYLVHFEQQREVFRESYANLTAWVTRKCISLQLRIEVKETAIAYILKQLQSMTISSKVTVVCSKDWVRTFFLRYARNLCKSERNFDILFLVDGFSTPLDLCKRTFGEHEMADISFSTGGLQYNYSVPVFKNVTRPDFVTWYIIGLPKSSTTFLYSFLTGEGGNGRKLLTGEQLIASFDGEDPHDIYGGIAGLHSSTSKYFRPFLSGCSLHCLIEFNPNIKEARVLSRVDDSLFECCTADSGREYIFPHVFVSAIVQQKTFTNSSIPHWSRNALPGSASPLVVFDTHFAIILSKMSPVAPVLLMWRDLFEVFLSRFAQLVREKAFPLSSWLPFNRSLENKIWEMSSCDALEALLSYNQGELRNRALCKAKQSIQLRRGTGGSITFLEPVTDCAPFSVDYYDFFFTFNPGYHVAMNAFLFQERLMIAPHDSVVPGAKQRFHVLGKIISHLSLGRANESIINRNLLLDTAHGIHLAPNCSASVELRYRALVREATEVSCEAFNGFPKYKSICLSQYGGRDESLA